MVTMKEGKWVMHLADTCGCLAHLVHSYGIPKGPYLYDTPCFKEYFISMGSIPLAWSRFFLLELAIS